LLDLCESLLGNVSENQSEVEDPLDRLCVAGFDDAPWVISSGIVLLAWSPKVCFSHGESKLASNACSRVT
jgi:hypothetical protein